MSSHSKKNICSVVIWFDEKTSISGYSSTWGSAKSDINSKLWKKSIEKNVLKKKFFNHFKNFFQIHFSKSFDGLLNIDLKSFWHLFSVLNQKRNTVYQNRTKFIVSQKFATDSNRYRGGLSLAKGPYGCQVIWAIWYGPYLQSGQSPVVTLRPKLRNEDDEFFV